MSSCLFIYYIENWQSHFGHFSITFFVFNQIDRDMIADKAAYILFT